MARIPGRERPRHLGHTHRPQRRRSGNTQAKAHALFVEYDENIHDILSDEATDLRYQPLYRLIDSLQDDYDRKLLFLYIDRHPLREIADITGTTEAAVKQRLYRIRQQLIEIKQQDTDYE